MAATMVEDVEAARVAVATEEVARVVATGVAMEVAKVVAQMAVVLVAEVKAGAVAVEVTAAVTAVVTAEAATAVVTVARSTLGRNPRSRCHGDKRRRRQVVLSANRRHRLGRPHWRSTGTSRYRSSVAARAAAAVAVAAVAEVMEARGIVSHSPYSLRRAHSPRADQMPRTVSRARRPRRHR